MLKRYTEYTNKELAAVTNEELENLINLECMVNGVTPAIVEPRYIEVPDVPEKDVRVYVVKVNDPMFTDIEEAKAIADAINSVKTRASTDYDYSVGYNYRYLVRNVDVATVESGNCYSRERFNEVKGILASANTAKKKNEKIKDEYDEVSSKYREIRKEVIEKYNEAIDERRDYQAAKDIFESYMAINGKNLEETKKYFALTKYADYTGEIVEELQGQGCDQA